MKRWIIIVYISILPISVFAHKEKWDDYKGDWSELMLAIYYSDTAKYIKLIKHNNDLNYYTPRNWQLTALDVAIRKDNSHAVEALLNTKKIKHPKSYLMTAAAQNNSKTIDLLIKFGANPNDTLNNGYSVLMMAASFGSYEVLECLLKHGANVKQTRKGDGITALMLAAFDGQLQKVKLLLDYKADKRTYDKNGETALNYVDNIYPYLKISEKTKTELRNLLK
jgi:ankyrin repeat protein